MIATRDRLSPTWVATVVFLLCLFVGLSCTNSTAINAASPPLASIDSVDIDITNAESLTIYDDALGEGWDDWSWDSTLDFDAATVVHAGSHAIAVTPDAGWSALSLRTSPALVASNYSALAFWIYGNGAPLRVNLHSADGGDPLTAYDFIPAAGEWAEVIIPLTELGSPARIARINWQNFTENPQPVFYIDDIRLIGNGSPAGEPITLHVDAAAARKPISPYIYGMNEYGTEDDDATLLEELRLPVRRWGGNATSRYNYQTDISNHASDWFFNNYKQSDATDLPNDSVVNRFIDTNRAAGADTLLVLPLSGYVSNNDPFACGFRVSVYGPQQQTAAADGRPDCGNGIRPDGTLITGNNPLDTSIAIDESFVAGWVSHLIERHGNANAGGVRFYNYDNEPDLWFESHRDVWPIGYTYDEIRDITYQYGPAIKAVDPDAQLMGPVVHGWSYYWHSPYDGQRNDWGDPDDRNAHGGTPFVAWYLQQMAAYEEANGVRILDYLDLHYYPQADGVALEGAGNAATQALRLRSTRSLWDPTYVDESWIRDAGPDDGIVRLIPRMREWVAENYPGTKLAIGEYNWGGQEHINGALAQADVLGIFGREGLDFATLWQPPRLNQPAAFAFRIYRNYDGAGSQFGDTSVAAASSDQDRLSIYAAERSSDGALTIVIINKSEQEERATLTLNNVESGAPVQLYRYSEANLNAIVRGNDFTIAGGQFTATYPANSITLLVLPQDAPQNFNSRLHLPWTRH